MDPKVPNKLASIFVTGGLAAVFITFFYGKGFIGELYSIGEIVVPGEAATFYAVINSARFLVVVTGAITLVGAIMQGVGHGIRSLLQHALTREWACKALMNKSARDEIHEWTKLYVDLSNATYSHGKRLVSPSPGSAPPPSVAATDGGEAQPLAEAEAEIALRREIFARIYDLGNERDAPFPKTVHPIVPRQSVSIFFRFATGLHLSWVLQHYATYYLTTDILASLLVTGVVVPILRGKAIFAPSVLYESGLVLSSFQMFIWYAALMLICYLLLVVSTHRYLYVYNAVLRQCCAAMSYPNPNYPNLDGAKE